MFEIIMIMDECIYAYILWFSNKDATFRKMHTVKRKRGREIVACDIFFIGGSAMCDKV